MLLPYSADPMEPACPSVHPGNLNDVPVSDDLPKRSDVTVGIVVADVGFSCEASEQRSPN